MIGHNNDGTGAYHKVFRGDIDACIVQPFDFAAEVADVDNGAVAENIHLFTAENAGRQKIQRKCAVVVFDGVSCIVAALVTNNNVIFFRNEVNHSALALIAPVDAHDGACFHNLYSPFCIKPELFAKPKLCSGFVSGIECCIAAQHFVLRLIRVKIAPKVPADRAFEPLAFRASPLRLRMRLRRFPPQRFFRKDCRSGVLLYPYNNNIIFRLLQARMRGARFYRNAKNHANKAKTSG